MMEETAAATAKVVIKTLGCRSNQYDSSALADMLRAAGYEPVTAHTGANLVEAYIINTCTVTTKTDYQSRRLIRRARRENPDAVIIVTGCYAQVAPVEVGAVGAADYVVGNLNKADIVEYIKRGRPAGGPETIVEPGSGVPFTLRAESSHYRTRVNLKVQDGCNRRCSFCIIPRARGASRSLPSQRVLAEIQALGERGYKEVILTGIHLGSYGADLDDESSLTGLLRAIEKAGFPCRIRLSSLDPDEVAPELIEILSTSRAICNHLHLALQSGDDSVLRQMRRPYTRATIKEGVEELVKKVDSVSIGLDVIAGFPGEGPEEFENTYSLIKDLPVAYLHVFPFSPRPGTPAAGFPDQVDGLKKKERAARLKELHLEKRDAFYMRFSEKVMDVLVESARSRSDGMLRGRTSNYIPVAFDGPDELMGDIVSVRLGEVRDGVVVGRVPAR